MTTSPFGHVKWESFCGNPHCSCAEPDRNVCPEFEHDDPSSTNLRCFRCGWPARHHKRRWAEVDRIPRRPSADEDDAPWRVTCWLCGWQVWSTTDVRARASWRRHLDRDHEPLTAHLPFAPYLTCRCRNHSVEAAGWQASAEECGFRVPDWVENCTQPKTPTAPAVIRFWRRVVAA